MEPSKEQEFASQEAPTSTQVPPSSPVPVNTEKEDERMGSPRWIAAMRKLRELLVAGHDEPEDSEVLMMAGAAILADKVKNGEPADE